MASNVTDIISKAEIASSGIIAPEYVTEIIQDAPKSSVMLNNARTVRMSTRTRTQPVLDSKPTAYWVGGDTGLKQTSKQAWSGINLTAEELAVIIPIPEAVIADSEIDLWAEIRPRVAEAIGYKVDQATIFGGDDKPASFPDAILTSATSAGNIIQAGTGEDLGVDVANLAEKLAKEGFAVNGFATEPGLNWQLIALRNASGNPIYQPDMQTAGSGNLYGFPLKEVDNGAWDSEKAVLMAADWNNFVVGIRQDMEYKLLDQAVITDDEGKVVLNLAQQDCVAMRVTFRMGFAVANPATAIGKSKSGRFPAGFVTPTA